MPIFDTAAVLVLIAAAFGYVNHRLLKLPSTSGTLLVALLGSFAILAIDAVFPSLQAGLVIAALLRQIDFNQTLMHGLLCFLLFAGALSVDLEDVLAHKWMIAVLATAGVILSTAITGVLTWQMLRVIGAEVPMTVCFVFGALISPTDPIAVMELLKRVKVPRGLVAQIAGESLFNDGVGVVVFLALVSIAGLGIAEPHAALSVDTATLLRFLAVQVLGGVALGVALGYVAYAAMKTIDYHPLELLITLALVMFIYAMSFWVHVSGPIAVVVAGLFIGNAGRRFAMSQNTREHVDSFWNMIDEVLNVILFLLLGLQVFAVTITPATLLAGAFAIPIALVARFVSVGIPIGLTPKRRRTTPALTQILTWTGLRGGISVALMLSLPPFPARDLLVACTYSVVVFSILVQGLTVRRLLNHYGFN